MSRTNCEAMAGCTDIHHVMHLIPDLELAGAQQCVCMLAQNWQARDWQLIVCVLHDGPLRPRIEASGVRVEFLRPPCCTVVNLPLYLIELCRIRRELVRLVEANHVELIQTHIGVVMDLVALSLRFTKHVKGVLWTMHGVDFLPQRAGLFLPVRRWVFRWLYRLLASKVDAFIAVSDAVRQAIIDQVGPIHHKIVTINNGVNVKQVQQPGMHETLCAHLGLDQDTHLVLTVGRLVEEKGHRYLIEAAANVIASHPTVHFLITGDGKLRQELQAQAQHSGYWHNIHFLGSRQDVPDLLGAADMFVLPSLQEGLPLALLEAMAAGIPLVATAIPGTTQVMIHGKTGLLVPPCDSAALAHAINHLLSEPAKAQAMGQAARRHVIENYSGEKQAREYVTLYRGLLRSEDEAAEL